MTESVWARIARLRQKDTNLLAPSVQRAWDRGRTTMRGRVVNVARPDAPEDLVALDACEVVETLRVQEMQDIYFAQGSTKAKSVLKSWHGYACAFDVFHHEYGWFTNRASVLRWPDPKQRGRASILWYRACADILTEDRQLAWGGLWKTMPDSPHFQSALVPVSPMQITIDTYTKAGGALPGRQAVWSLYHLD